MIRRENQIRFQFTIKCPEEELDTIRIYRVGVHRLVWLENAGKSRAEEVEIIVLKAPPDTNILVQVLSKLHQDMRQYPACATGEMERVIRQRTLGFMQKTHEVLGHLDEWSLTASKMFVRAVVMKSHG